AAARGGSGYLFGIRGIDRGGQPRFRVVDEHAEIVGTADKNLYFQRLHDRNILILIVGGKCRDLTLEVQLPADNIWPVARRYRRSPPILPFRAWTLRGAVHRGGTDLALGTAPRGAAGGPWLCRALSRPLPRRHRAHLRLHAGGAGGGELADGLGIH